MSDTTNRLAGIAQFVIDGTTFMLVGELKYKATTLSRETLTGQDAVHGYKEMPEAPFIAGRLRDSGTMRTRDFQEMTNVTVQAELANGKAVSGSQMWNVTATEVDAVEGTFDVRFEGFQVEEN